MTTSLTSMVTVSEPMVMSWRLRKYADPPVPRSTSRCDKVPGVAAWACLVPIRGPRSAGSVSSSSLATNGEGSPRMAERL
jgi:hypothetical protein